ncbi:MAG: SGNH/GDSL hydrolase family protein [Lachnospiraceae bacterium]|nr:SGNH/GDSL hydrolase family protein [Lachnospiraceae bacterium]
MKKNRLILESLVSILIVAVVIIIATASFSGKKKEYDLIIFGDSIIGNDRSDESVTALISKESGLNCLNAAFGGTRLTSDNSKNSIGEKENLYSVEEIAKALACDDIERFRMAAFSENYSARFYFQDVVKKLGHVNFKKARFIIIQSGTNDYLSGVKVGSEDEENTFIHSLHETVKNLKKASPEAEIIILTPCFNDIFLQDERNCLNVDYGGGTLDKYVEAELSYGKKYGISVIDNLNDSKIKDETVNEYLLDGLHPNAEGNREIADTIWNFIARQTQ